MGIFDQAKEFIQEHSGQADQGIDKAGDFVDGRTGGQHAEHVDRAQDFLKDRLGNDEVPPADAPPAPDPAAPPAQNPPPVQ